MARARLTQYVVTLKGNRQRLTEALPVADQLEAGVSTVPPAPFLPGEFETGPMAPSDLYGDRRRAPAYRVDSVLGAHMRRPMRFVLCSVLVMLVSLPVQAQQVVGGMTSSVALGELGPLPWVYASVGDTLAVEGWWSRTRKGPDGDQRVWGVGHVWGVRASATVGRVLVGLDARDVSGPWAKRALWGIAGLRRQSGPWDLRVVYREPLYSDTSLRGGELEVRRQLDGGLLVLAQYGVVRYTQGESGWGMYQSFGVGWAR